MSIKKNSSNKKIVKVIKEKVENKEINKEAFKRIKVKFREYWKILFRLIFIYITCYLVWAFSSKFLRQIAEDNNWSGEMLFLVVALALFQGCLFMLDGYVTALLKSPFNQMCYAINKVEGLSDKKKDYIISRATRSNEDCKETLKKFGIITIVNELASLFIKKNKFDPNTTEYEHLMVISYLVPLASAAWSIWVIHSELKKIEKSMRVTHEKSQPAR